jgi:hypothetical protein
LALVTLNQRKCDSNRVYRNVKILTLYIYIYIYTYIYSLFFLLTEKPFLDLISKDTPIDILEKICHVLSLNLKENNWLDLDIGAEENKPCDFVVRLCKLLHIKQPSESWKEVSS